jgi:hypothetical protein
VPLRVLLGMQLHLVLGTQHQLSRALGERKALLISEQRGKGWACLCPFPPRLPLVEQHMLSLSLFLCVALHEATSAVAQPRTQTHTLPRLARSCARADSGIFLSLTTGVLGKIFFCQQAPDANTSSAGTAWPTTRRFWQSTTPCTRSAARGIRRTSRIKSRSQGASCLLGLAVVSGRERLGQNHKFAECLRGRYIWSMRMGRRLGFYTRVMRIHNEDFGACLGYLQRSCHCLGEHNRGRCCTATTYFYG